MDNSGKSNENRLSALQKKARMLYSGTENNKLVTYLEKLSSSESNTVIRPFTFCLEVIEMIMANTVNFSAQNYYQIIKRAESLYQEIFIYDENTRDLRDIQLVFLEFFEEDGIIAKNLYKPLLFLSFRDKNNYIYFMNTFLQEEDARMILPELEGHAVDSRQYFVDDMEYTFHMIDVAAKLLKVTAIERKGLLELEMRRLERMNGIYDIDAVDIARAEVQLDETKALIKQGADIIAVSDQKSKQLRLLEEELTNKINDSMRREEELLEAKVAAYREQLQTDYDSFVAEQKNRLVFQREEFVEKLFSEAEKELASLKATAQAVASTTSKELAKANKDAENIINKAYKMAHEDTEIQTIINKSISNQAFMDKLSKIQILNDSNIEALGKLIEEKKSEETTEIKQTAANTLVVKQIPEKTESVNDSEEEKPTKLVNAFDEKIHFKQRFEELMAEKKIRQQLGEHFHEKFDDVLIAVMENSNPYLIGPSGCGKTFMVNQIAEMLGIASVDIGYINEEYDILGFQTANGGYSKPNFYRCYKYGKMAFCDELDNGNSRATVKLNSFLSNNKDASYNFPNGEHVRRHENFRIIAAGNTSGAGADENYSTREKIEESVQQRFMPIYIDYDNAVEKKILGKYPEWYEFCVLFREATDAFESDSGTVAPGILTTRDTVKIKRYMDNQSFTPEKIIKYEFIQTKDVDYLLFLDKYMGKNSNKYKKANGLVKLFSEQVAAICKNGGKR